MKAAEHRMSHDENHPHPHGENHHHHKNWVQYMLGEMFFKDNDNYGNDENDENDDLEEYNEDLEHLPYQVIQKNEVRLHMFKYF